MPRRHGTQRGGLGGTHCLNVRGQLGRIKLQANRQPIQPAAAVGETLLQEAEQLVQVVEQSVASGCLPRVNSSKYGRIFPGTHLGRDLFEDLGRREAPVAVRLAARLWEASEQSESQAANCFPLGARCQAEAAPPVRWRHSRIRRHHHLE